MGRLGRATCTVDLISAPEQPEMKRMYHYIREAKSLLFKSIYSAHMPQVNMTSFFDRLWTYTGKKA